MQEPGFELTFPDDEETTFVPFTVSMTGSKDLKIIDRCTAMAISDFAEAFDDPVQRGRGPIMLAMIGLSIRSKYPDWSLERIMRVVDDIDISNVEFIQGSEAAADADPLPEKPSETDGSANSVSPSDESESSATPTDNAPTETTPSTSETSKPIPA